VNELVAVALGTLGLGTIEMPHMYFRSSGEEASQNVGVLVEQECLL
jgi:hypothetical protein